jgi:hypothetical protein
LEGFLFCAWISKKNEQSFKLKGNEALKKR